MRRRRTPIQEGLRHLVAFAIFCSFSVFAVDNVTWFGFEGRLFDASGYPLNSSGIAIKLQVYSASGGCLLYEETQTGLNLSSANTFEQGVFSVKVGGGTRSGLDPGLGFSQVFNNSNSVVGASGCAYTPTTSDVRYLRVSVDSGSGFETLSPDFAILSSPNAQVAQSVQGKAASDLIQVSGQVTQANMAVLVSGSDASSLHHHDSRYVQLGSSSSQNLGAGDLVTTGKIGIGTATPGQSLHIKNATGTASLRLEGTASTGSSIEFSAGGAIKTVIKTEGGSGNFVVVTEGQTALFIDHNGTMISSGNQFVGGYIRPGQISTAAETAVTTSLTTCGAPCSGGIWFNSTLGVMRAWTLTQGLLTAPFYSGTATSGQILTYNGTNWVASTLSTSDATKLPLTGGSLTGNLDLGGHNIVSVGAISVANGAFTSVSSSVVTISSAPVSALDATNKAYVDAQVSSVTIAVLRKDGSTPLTGNWSVGGFDFAAVGNLSQNANKSFRLSAVTTSAEPTLVSTFAGADAGSVWWNSTLNQLRYWDGFSIQTVGAGVLASLNGQTAAVQTLSVTSSAGSLGWTSAGGNHQLNIPAASGTTPGLLQTADYNIFMSKQSALGYVPLNSAGGAMSGNLVMSSGSIDLGSNQVISNSFGGGASFSFSTYSSHLGAGGLTIAENSSNSYKAVLATDSTRAWINSSGGRSTASLYVNGVVGLEYMSSGLRPACTTMDLGNVLVSDTGLEYCDGLNYRTLVTTKLQILPEHRPVIWVTGSASLKITSTLQTYPIRVSFPSGHVAELNGSAAVGSCPGSTTQWCYVYADDMGSGTMAFAVSVNDPSYFSGSLDRAYIGAVAFSNPLGGYIDVKKENSEAVEDTRPTLYISSTQVYIEPAEDNYPMRFAWGDDVRFAMNTVTYGLASCPIMAWCYIYASRDTLVPDQVNFNVSAYPASDSSNKGRIYLGAVWSTGSVFEPFNKKDKAITAAHAPVLETDGTQIFVGTADWTYPTRILFPSGEVGTGTPSAVVTNTFNCNSNAWCYIYAEYVDEGEATFFADTMPPQFIAVNYSRKYLGSVYKTTTFNKFIHSGRHFEMISQGPGLSLAASGITTLNLPTTTAIAYFETQVSTSTTSACIFELGFNYFDGAVGPQLQRILFNKESSVASPATYYVEQLRFMFDRNLATKQIYVQQNPSGLGSACAYSSPLIRLKAFDDGYL